MTREGLDIDHVLCRALAPPPDALIESGIENAYARFRLRRVSIVPARADAVAASHAHHWWKPAVTLATAAALIALAIGLPFSTRDTGIGVLEAADGSLYRVTNGNRIPIRAGDRIEAQDTLRVDGAGAAVLALQGGSKVEMRPETELALDRKDNAVTIHLNTGSIIGNGVAPAQGQVFVRTKDVTVSTDGAVSVVSALSDRSRVGAIQGDVRVREASLERILRPGEQVSTDRTLTPGPLKEEIAWSRNRDSYQRILDAFAKGMAQTAGPPASVATQPGQAAPAFEAASVKPCDPNALPETPAGARGGGPNSFQVTPGRLNALCMTVATLIRTAYGLGTLTGGDAPDFQYDRIYGLGRAGSVQIRGGPDWVRNEPYTIEAVGKDGGDPRTLAGPMLRDLLERRFKLAAHVETEHVSGFALIVQPGGPKLVPVDADACTPLAMGPNGGAIDRRIIERVRRGEPPACGLAILGTGADMTAVGGALTMSNLVRTLTDILGSRVIDRTNIPDDVRFNLVFEFALDERTAGPLGGRGRGSATGEPSTAADVFTALKEQLGLALESAKAPRGYIVIDRLERPDAN